MVSRLAVERVVIAGCALALVVSFQNCGKAFTSQDQTSAIPHGLTTYQTALNVYQSSAQVSDALPLGINVSYEVRLDGDNVNPSAITWSATTGVAGFANCALAGTAALTRSLSCSSVGLAHVEINANIPDSGPLKLVFERQVTGTVSPLPPSNVITFTIPAGTANKPWNTMATAPLVFKGQVLRIMNGDTTGHRMHGSGSPCPHQGGTSAPGQFYDCVIAAAHAATATNMYDHGAGNSAVFYVEAIDGVAQYNRKFNVGGVQKACMDCHGALAASAVRSMTFADIKNAIAINRGGMSALTLTDNEIKAIAYELAK